MWIQVTGAGGLIGRWVDRDEKETKGCQLRREVEWNVARGRGMQNKCKLLNGFWKRLYLPFLSFIRMGSSVWCRLWVDILACELVEVPATHLMPWRIYWNGAGITHNLGSMMEDATARLGSYQQLEKHGYASSVRAGIGPEDVIHYVVNSNVFKQLLWQWLEFG